MASQRRVKITGIIKDSGGFNLEGRLTVAATASMIDETTVPHGTITTQPRSFEVFGGKLDIRLHESATDSVPYVFSLYSNDNELISTFSAIVSNVVALDWDDLAPTAIVPDELDMGAVRVAERLTEEPYLSTLVNATIASLSSVTLTNSFTVPAALTGVTVTPGSAFISDGQFVTGQINGIPAKISRTGSVYTLTRIVPGVATAIAANSKFYIAPILNGSIAYITANATIATSGATTLAIAPLDFLANSSSVTGVIKSAFGTLARSSGGVYTFTPSSTLSATVSVVANTDVFFATSRPELPFKPPQNVSFSSSIILDADITSNFVIANAGDFALDISNGADGQVVSLAIAVQSSASITIVPGSSIKIPDGLLSTFSGLSASKSYLTTFKRVGSLWWCVSLSPPYS